MLPRKRLLDLLLWSTSDLDVLLCLLLHSLLIRVLDITNIELYLNILARLNPREFCGGIECFKQILSEQQPILLTIGNDPWHLVHIKRVILFGSVL